jgi:hypothetical protein
MSLLSSWGHMRNPKKLHHTSSKNRRRPLATRRPLPSRPRKRRHKTLQKRAAAQRAAAPRISEEIQEHVAQADVDALSRSSEIVRQTLDSGTVSVPPSEVDHRENLGNRTGIVEQRRPFLPSSVFTNGVSAITSVSAISMEWFNLLLRCAERSLGAMQIFMRCRTPGEFFTAYGNLLGGNLNDAFEGANKVLRQTRR